MKTPNINRALSVLRKHDPELADLVADEAYRVWEQRGGLLQALKIYGTHKLSCHRRNNGRRKCNCGLALTIRQAEAA